MTVDVLRGNYFALEARQLTSDASMSLETLQAIREGRIEEAAEAIKHLLAMQVERIRIAADEGLEVDLRRRTVEDHDELIDIVGRGR